VHTVDVVMSNLTRRSFLHGAAATATAAKLVSGDTNRAPIMPGLKTFPYGAVQLLDSPLKRQFDQNHTFFLNLSEDRLLKIYRQRAGLPAPGENMGGWYDDFCPGAHFGQYVSALARFGAATGSEPTRAKANRLVKGYAETIDPTGNFFKDLRYPAYTYDKLVCMLIDAHQYAGNRDAAAILRATTRAARPHMPDHALTPQEQRERPHKDETYTWDESYTLAENLFLAYQRLGDRTYFDMGQRYLLDKTFFDPLSEGQNVLPGLHAYSHVNALSSGMQGYLKLGNEKYLRAVSNAIQMIWNDQSFATGGWGPNEGFVEPGKGQLGKSLSTTHRSFETPCGAYAHFKAMRYLLGLTQDTRYGDSMERVLYNTVLGAKPIQEDGFSFYYSDYHHSGVKTDHRVIPDARYPWDRDGRWPCCSGTLPQIAADYTISAYFHDNNGIYINLYVPARLTSNVGGGRWILTQRTDYPTGDLITMQMELSSPREAGLHLRIPAWAGRSTSISVNGKRQKAAVIPGKFFALQREWKTGDIVELELHQRLRTEAVDRQTPEQVAVLRGPQVLFAIANTQPELTAKQFESLTIKRAENYDWTTEGLSPNLRLRPFYAIGDEVYQTYWKVNV